MSYENNGSCCHLSVTFPIGAAIGLAGGAAIAWLFSLWPFVKLLVAMSIVSLLIGIGVIVFRKISYRKYVRNASAMVVDNVMAPAPRRPLHRCQEVPVIDNVISYR